MLSGRINNYEVFFKMFGKKNWLRLASLLLIFSIKTYAVETEVVITTPIVEPNNAYWTFSGIVANESGEQFGYFFQMEKQGTQFHVQSALLNGQTNKVIFSYDKKETISSSIDNKWKIGDAFLRFNPINESWVFGVKTAEKKGFNFKVDMLNQPIENSEIQTLRPGLEALVHQTSRLNGHLKVGSEAQEQFVTANNAWFSKTWLSAKQDSLHDINSSFCRFNDGSGFYTENLKEKDAKRAALASWRDALGNSVKMSQFISKDFIDNKTWKIRLALPKLEIKFENQLDDNSASSRLVAGFFKENVKGFCFLSQQEFTA
jgi:uncharacterized protein YhaN